MTRLALSRDIRALETRAPEGVSLMARAGQAAADFAARLAADTGQAVLVVAGPGNNGGDAWVCAERLRESFHRVTMLDATGTLPADFEARRARDAFVAAGARVIREWPAERFGLVVDGLLGIGLARDVEGAFAELIGKINASETPVLSLDIPSGLDADTGIVRGAAVRADCTLTFLALKPGLFTGDGVDHAGVVQLDPLGVEDDASGGGMLLTPSAVRGWLSPRDRNSHKGTYRTLGVIGGTRGMVGAALIAARAGLYTGAGKVYVGLLAPDAPAFDPAAPELMLRSIDDTMSADVIVAGPGAGLSPTATSRSTFERSVLPAIVSGAKPVVLDADALSAIAVHDELAKALQARVMPAILTPHPGEAARLLKATTADIQRDRVAAALELARRYNAHVVLKGAGSVCAGPGGDWSVNATGNPGLASGGTGDALAGMIGSMLCQGLDPARALAYAVCLHGAAADACVETGIGPCGLTASDVILEARRLMGSDSIFSNS